ncbi:unnamed protein product [Moneuplotes crassus]|uniref:Uncharacterized protein n=1 Tax=Euplotes crassus TaxID=5936 RepID=A0AAD1XYJ6_EUPCR|nr:unnamed protein product [Moneuplotes crassus]
MQQISEEDEKKAESSYFGSPLIPQNKGSEFTFEINPIPTKKENTTSKSISTESHDENNNEKDLELNKASTGHFRIEVSSPDEEDRSSNDASSDEEDSSLESSQEDNIDKQLQSYKNSEEKDQVNIWQRIKNQQESNQRNQSESSSDSSDLIEHTADLEILSKTPVSNMKANKANKNERTEMLSKSWKTKEEKKAYKEDSRFCKLDMLHNNKIMSEDVNRILDHNHIAMRSEKEIRLTLKSTDTANSAKFDTELKIKDDILDVKYQSSKIINSPSISTFGKSAMKLKLPIEIEKEDEEEFIAYRDFNINVSQNNLLKVPGPKVHRNTYFHKNTTKFENPTQKRDTHSIEVHDRLVILFATVLLKIDRINDCLTVLNFYGRRCLHGDSLTRANMYKLLSLSLLETDSDGSTEKALKNCEKALEKYRHLESNQGIVSCMLIKLYILQLIKFKEDPFESDEDESFDIQDSPKSIGKTSKINNLIEESCKRLNKCPKLSIKQKESIINELYLSERMIRPIDIKNNQSISKFLNDPIFTVQLEGHSFTPQKYFICGLTFHSKSEVVVIKKSPISSMMETKVEEWFKTHFSLLHSIPEKSSNESNLNLNKKTSSSSPSEKEKEEYIKKLFEYLDKNMLEINTSIMSGGLQTKNSSVDTAEYLKTKNKVDVEVSTITLEPSKIPTRDVEIQDNTQYSTKSINVNTLHSSRDIDGAKSKEETKMGLKALQLNKPNVFKCPVMVQDFNIERNSKFVDPNYFLPKTSNKIYSKNEGGTTWRDEEDHENLKFDPTKTEFYDYKDLIKSTRSKFSKYQPLRVSKETSLESRRSFKTGNYQSLKTFPLRPQQKSPQNTQGSTSHRTSAFNQLDITRSEYGGSGGRWTTGKVVGKPQWKRKG